MRTLIVIVSSHIAFDPVVENTLFAHYLETNNNCMVHQVLFGCARICFISPSLPGNINRVCCEAGKVFHTFEGDCKCDLHKVLLLEKWHQEGKIFTKHLLVCFLNLCPTNAGTENVGSEISAYQFFVIAELITIVTFTNELLFLFNLTKMEHCFRSDQQVPLITFKHSELPGWCLRMNKRTSVPNTGDEQPRSNQKEDKNSNSRSKYLNKGKDH